MRRWIIKLLEKWLGIYREGPECPIRFLTPAADYVRQHPDATAEDLELMAVNLARAAYLQGYVRGYEHVERLWTYPDPSPETIADFEAPGWQNSPPIRFDGHLNLEIERDVY